MLKIPVKGCRISHCWKARTNIQFQHAPHIINNYPIRNNNFTGQFLAAAQITDIKVLQGNWYFVTRNVFMGIVALGIVIDTLSCTIKTLVYGLRRAED